MKTIDFFNEAIKRKLLDLNSPGKLTKTEARVLVKEIDQFRSCRALLESNVGEQFIKEQLDATVKYVDEKMKEFDESRDWSNVPKPVESELRKKFQKKWDIAHKKDQIRFMRFLLD